MAIVKINSTTSTFIADDAETTYVVGKNAIVDTTTTGIDLAGDAKYRVLRIDGKVEADDTGVAIDDQAAPFGGVRLSISESGSVSGGSYGLLVHGQGHVVHNAGTITSADAGIQSYGTNSFVNSGTIHGDSFGLYLSAGTGEGQSVVTNSGTISGGNHAIYGSYEYEKIINSGKILGDVDLGAGDDVFVFKAGKVDGTVAGSLGDDIYIVNKAGLTISEDFNEGADRIYSSVSLDMPAYVENLYLTGKKDLHATGGTGGNNIYGNAGANTIDGAGGMDYLDGGRGNDILTGGSSSDDFHFARGTGRDIVTDYEAGFDEIRLGDLKGATDYTDMLAHHAQQKGGDLWLSYGQDVVVLKDTAIADLKAGDFDFV